MKWIKEPYQDGDGFAWVMKTPIGEFVVDSAPWIDARQPWQVYWWAPGSATESAIGRRSSAKSGMAMADRYVRRLTVRLVEMVGA